MAASPTSSISFQNFFQATLSGDITAESTDIPLDTIPNGSEGFLVIDPDNANGREIIYYNSKTALAVTCPSVADGRGQDDTTAGPHTAGTTVIMAPIAAYYEALLSLFTTSPQGWTSLAGTIPSVTYNGNRNYDLTTSTDQTSVLSPGMRLRTTRTVAAPTQSTSLNGTNQYWNKTSPAGFTFTDDFTVGAWVKPDRYTGANMVIASRYNGTSGWRLMLNSDGQLNLSGYNGASGNFSRVVSFVSVPLNEWSYVCAQLDMSAFTVSSTTSYAMINGLSVTAEVSRGGTNPTALVQAGNLEIGSSNGGTEPFSGKIAQVAIFNAKVTQATLRSYASQSLAGTETSLISAYSFNNSSVDLNTANANNLTANGSAAATNADSPFGGKADGTISSTQDYMIVQKVTSGAINVQVPEGCTVPTSGGVSSASYSTYKIPYGFPVATYKWTIRTNARVDVTQNTPTSGTWYSTKYDITVPAGSWRLGYVVTAACFAATAIAIRFQSGLGTLAASAPNTDAQAYSGGTNLTTDVSGHVAEIPVNPTSSTTYYLNMATNQASSSSILLSCANSPGYIYAENAYL